MLTMTRNWLGPYGQRPILTAELLCAGANPGVTDTEGRTPLHWALDPPKDAKPKSWDHSGG
jgi:hypothetical protein